jgi:site-specific DNA-cytosine methylase
MSNPDLWLGKGEQKAEGKKADPLSSVEATAKALEGVSKNQLPLVRDVASNILREYEQSKNEIERLNKERDSLTDAGKDDIVKKSGYVKSTKYPNFYEFSTGASIRRKTKQEIVDDYYDKKVKKLKKDAPNQKVLELYQNQDRAYSTPQNISEAYHAAKKDGSNPELVKAVEDLLGEKAEGKKADPIIEALEKGKIKGAAGMNIAVWNATIDTIKAAYIAGKALAEAINEGIAYLKSKGEDVSKYQDALDDIRKAEKPRVATFFSGAGTMEAALPESESVMAVEYSPTYMKAYNDAFGTKYEARDVTQINPQEVKAANPDIFHASPVCKNFSKAKSFNIVRKQDMDSAESVARVIREAQPPVVTIENVPDYQKYAPFNVIIQALKDAGYTYDVGVYNAADYGGVQNRRRLLVRAVKDGKLPALPEKQKPGDWYKALKDLIDDAPDTKFVPKTNEEHWEVERINKMIADGRLDASKPILTMGASAFKDQAAAANSGGPSYTLLSSSNAVPRIIMPDGRIKRVTPEMMKRLMDLPLSYPVPADAKVAKEVLGNGMDGAFTKALIEPLIKPVKEEDRVEKFLKNLYWKEGGLGMNAGLWNAAVTTMLKAYHAGKTVYEAIQAGIEELTKEGENIKDYEAVIDKATEMFKKEAQKEGREIGTPPTAAQPQQKKATTPPSVTPTPTTTEGAELPETPEGQVPKKVVERRYKADSPEMQEALEEIGLFRTPGNINEAQAAANALVRKVGVDAALEVADKETINGLYKIGIVAAALDDIEARRNATNDYEEYVRLTNEAARVTVKLSSYVTTSAQEMRMYQEVLRSQTLPFEYEARKKAFVEQFGQEAFTKEVQERFESLDKQLKEALAKVNELEEQKAAWERQSVIDSLAEQKPEPPASRKSFFKEAAARVRKLIVSKPGIFSAATPASLAWDASIEAVAVALEGLGTLELAIGKGLDKLRSTEWYRKLSQSKKDEAEKAFKESVEKAYIPEITVDDNGKVVIPQGALKAYVEAGYRDAEEIVDNIYNKLSPDNPNLTKRDVRDAISGYGRKYNPTPNQVRDQINEIKAIGRLISAIEDAENGIEKATNPKTKKQISDRLQALKEQYEAAYMNSFGRKPTQPSEATRYATVKRNMEKEIERLRAMKPRPERRPPVDYDAQLEALATEKFRLQEEWDAEFGKQEWKSKTMAAKVGDIAYGLTQLPKSLMAGGFDLGMLLIQGSMLSVADLSITKQAAKNLGKALWSEKEYQKEIAKIRNSELYRIIRKSKLDLTIPFGQALMAEETGIDTLAESLFNLLITPLKYIPTHGPKAYEFAKRFNFIRALNRAQTAYMNTLRVGNFLVDMQNMQEKGITFYNNPQAYKEAADAINTMSGRGGLYGAERSKIVIRGLNIIFFSPKNWSSILRLFTPVGLLIELGTKRAGAEPYKMSVSQARIVKTMARYIAGTSLATLGIYALTGGDEDDEEKKKEPGNVSVDLKNPQSSAFGKIRVGNQIFDPWGGKMQIITLQARLLIHAFGGYGYKDPFTGIEKKLQDSYFKTPGGLVGEYVKGKFAPSMRAPWQIANSIPVPGRPGWFRPVEGGKEFYIFEPFQESYENLTIQALKETYGNQPLTVAEIATLMIIAGGGVTTLNDQEDLTTVTKIRNLLSPGEDEIKKFKKAFGSYLKAGDYDMAEKIFDRATGTTPLYQNLQLQQEMGKPTAEAKRQLDRKRKQSVADLFGGIQEDNLVQKYSFEKKYRDEIIDAVYKDKTLSTYGMSEKKAKMFERINALTPEMKEDIKRNYDLQYEELMTVAKGLDKVAERADGYYEKKAKRTSWVRQYLRLTGKEEKQ